ncbi:YfgM family protein [Marinobacter sp. X15-166B]|uniref:YfgM family protein n=1 Tax=Marinobacter sp. X15-166B TaxID=1897620 RepID=UPI00085BB24F|nr:tetratricopeptide repeat protein [Marinobacter sp. X15-166B]OEY67380.1 hypothetical protein BG841_13660 [Marinobacter sp. X15-166B]
MAELRTEEEQIQAIKDWWKKNGSSLLIGIGAALAIIFGWQAWQNHQSQQRAAAASQFATLLNAYGDTSDENRTDTVAYVADELRAEFAGSAYATYGMLILAQQQLLEQNDVAAAIESLQWARSHVDKKSALNLIVLHRLATAQLAGGRLDEALATLGEAEVSEAFRALFEELKGDILLAKGEPDQARDAYLVARQHSLAGGNGLLEIKLADLGVGEDA